MSKIPTTELQAAFDAELTRLATLGLSPEQTTLARRYYSQAERESMDESDFCGPHRSFPITSEADVENAAHLIGKADNPAAVKACIKGKAKAHGWKLPASWEQDESEDRTMAASTPTPATSEDAPHPPMTGKHSHAHPHMDGYDHEHEHEHHNDNVHDHAHMHATHRSQISDAQVKVKTDIDPFSGVPHEYQIAPHMYMPITRIDADNWEVEGVATSEEVDSYGTIFSYEASKRAFERWAKRHANVREMHDKKAVAKGILYRCDDANRQIIVRSRVSRGAPDTWQKVLDDILCGYSVGATKPKWQTIERNGKTYPYLVEYELTELSLVDNPSNPDCDFALCRADGLTEVVDVTEPEQTTLVTPETTRVGATHSAATRQAMHEVRDHQIQGAMKSMQACGCEDCQHMCHAIDPDGDGDNDLTDGPADTDHDANQLAERVMALIEQRIQVPILRMQAIAGTFARAHTAEIDTTPLVASLEGIAARLSSLDEVRADLSAVKGQVDRIAAQPAPGGPVLNGAYPVDKRLATDPPRTYPSQPTHADLRAGLDRMQEQGDLQKQMDQLAAAALTLQRFQGRIGS